MKTINNQALIKKLTKSIKTYIDIEEQILASAAVSECLNPDENIHLYNMGKTAVNNLLYKLVLQAIPKQYKNVFELIEMEAEDELKWREETIWQKKQDQLKKKTKLAEKAEQDRQRKENQTKMQKFLASLSAEQKKAYMEMMK